MSCNIRIPIQQIIDDVAAALSGRYISTDNPFLNEAVLTDTTLRGDVTADTTARAALCGILQNCGVTAEELEWLNRPNLINAVPVSVSVDAAADDQVVWKSLDELISWGNIKGDINSQIDLLEREVKAENVVTSPDLVGAVERSQEEKNADSVSARVFGVIGDKIADDTAAIQRAIRSGVLVDWDGLQMNHTGINETVDSIQWKASGACFFYTGAYAHKAFSITMASDSNIEGSLVFDAQGRAHLGLDFRCESTTTTPELRMGIVKSINVRRATKDFIDGDGIKVSGGFNRLRAKEIIVKDCFMNAGADIGGSQGIFGFTTTGISGKFIKHIDIDKIHVENIWSEDPLNFADQDGVRIFQDMIDLQGSCNISEYHCINAANRMLKLHSAPNATIGRVVRVLDSKVIPQSGEFDNPDIDGQQAAFTIDSVNFIYDGANHNRILQNYSKDIYNPVANCVVNSVKGVVKNVDGRAMSILALQPFVGSTTNYQATVSNVVVDGAIGQIVSMTVSEGSKPNVVINNAIVNVVNAVRVVGASASVLSVGLNNIINTNPTKVPALSKYSDTYTVVSANCIGFTDTLSLYPSSSGLGINGKANAALDINPTDAAGVQRVRLNGSKTLTALDGLTAYTGWYEWYNQGTGQRVGLMGYAAAGGILEFRNEAGGNIEYKIGSYAQFRVLASGGVEARKGYYNDAAVAWNAGVGSPESVVTAPKGSMYSRTDGTAAESLYIKTTATGNTGWKATTLVA